MYNLSESIIPFEVVENGTVIHTGQIPYDLFNYIVDEYLRNTDRVLNLSILSTPFTFTASYNQTDDPVSPTIQSANEYRIWQNSIEIQNVIEYNAAQQAVTNQTISEEERAEGERILAQLAQAGQLQYEAMLQEQNLLTAERAQELEAEQYRLDILRAQTVTQIAVNPMSVVEALESEVGNNLDVQRQIAAVMKSNPEVTKLILNSTPTLWNGSYEILDVAAVQAIENPEIANLLVSKIPQDSLLYRSLDLLGLVN